MRGMPKKAQAQGFKSFFMLSFAYLSKMQIFVYILIFLSRINFMLKSAEQATSLTC